MTTTIEVLDALPGCGKTTAIFKYMAENQATPWLYLSPVKDEIDNRVEQLSSEYDMQFYVPREDEDSTKTAQILEFMRNGYNVACTHALMMRFTKDHVAAIRQWGYAVCSDEELSLISGYNIAKADFDFLKRNNLLEIDPVNGKVSFSDSEMSTDSRYGDVKQLADMGCLFAAKRSERMLVCQLSTALILAASRFILLSYNYNGSIMQTFMQLHGIGSSNIDYIELYRTNEQVISKLSELLVVVNTPRMQEIRDTCSLSKSWWETNTVKKRQEVYTAMASIPKMLGVKAGDVFFTLPKSVIAPSKGHKTAVKSNNLSHNNFIACNVRATNNYAHKQLAIHAYTLYPNTAVKSYMQDLGYACDDDVYALNMLLQWLFRGCIRDGEPMQVVLLSAKMHKLLLQWMNQ